LSFALTSRHAITRRARPLVFERDEVLGKEEAGGGGGEEGGVGSKKLLRIVSPVAPLFSGWN